MTLSSLSCCISLKFMGYNIDYMEKLHSREEHFIGDACIFETTIVTLSHISGIN